MNKDLISNRPIDEQVGEIFELLKVWKYNIEEEINFSFIKFGDGEFACMNFEVGENCDRHEYSENLGKKLLKSWKFLTETHNIYIGQWSNHKPGMAPMSGLEKFLHLNIENKQAKFVNYEILLQNLLCQDKYNFLGAIKNSKRKKCYIGPERLSNGVMNFLNIEQFIEIPLINCFDKYDEILEKLESIIQDDMILLFTSGMPTKCFVYDVLNKNKNLTCLDFGSGFDALFYGVTREGQINTNTLREYYKELL